MTVDDRTSTGATAGDIISAALRLVGAIRHGQVPGRAEADGCLFHLESLEKLYAGAELTPSDMALLLVGRIKPEFSTAPQSPRIPAAAAGIQWQGDDLNASPGAYALLATIPDGFQATPELLGFFYGDQWDLDTLKYRTDRGRMCLVINMLPRLFALALGSPVSPLTSSERNLLKAWIAHRNNDAQRMHNYMCSHAVDMARAERDSKQARLLNPDDLVDHVWKAQCEAAAEHEATAGQGAEAGACSPELPLGPGLRAQIRAGALAAIDFFLKSPRAVGLENPE
jgi:hypothetical protein